MAQEDIREKLKTHPLAQISKNSFPAEIKETPGYYKLLPGSFVISSVRL